jgi:hypothetical protein
MNVKEEGKIKLWFYSVAFGVGGIQLSHKSMNTCKSGTYQHNKNFLIVTKNIAYVYSDLVNTWQVY